MSKLKPIFDQLFTSKMPSEYVKKSHYSVFENAIETNKSNESLPVKNKLRELFGKENEPFSTTIGVHPDFLDLEELEERNQYICSVFLDISGSTKLGFKFPLSVVKFYKNAIMKSAIEIFQVFDGHIHRLQGDAVFAYFGHKGMKKSDAIINALNASALMQSYNKNTLTQFFEENGLEPLKIRIGIDVGDEKHVLWSSYGIDNITEVTSTSIHTDLAAKLQNKSPRNKIMIGENVYKYLDLPKELLDIKTFVKDGDNYEDKTIISGSNYQMRIFKWDKYLAGFSFLPKEQSTKFHSPEDFEIVAQFGENEHCEAIIPFKSNVIALPKGAPLSFKLELKNKSIRPNKIVWKVINRGEEAENSESPLTFEMEDNENKDTCEQKTAFNGHHFMQCSIYDSLGKLVGQDQFGIYVNDEEIEMLELGVSEDSSLTS